MDDNIIVLVKDNDKFYWYLSDKDCWIMDYEKFAHQFNPNDNDFSERFGIAVLQENSKADFFEHMKRYQVSQHSLTSSLCENFHSVSVEDRGDFFPTLFLDFDSKHMSTMHSELLQFEKFVPFDWTGEYIFFYDSIPENLKYWIVDGSDYLKLLLDGDGSPAGAGNN